MFDARRSAFAVPPLRRWCRPARDERGQAAFEFLLILPLFIPFVLLLVDLGVVMYSYVSVANATREGARFAAVNCAGSCSLALVRGRTAERSSGFVAYPSPTPPAAPHTIDVVWGGVSRGSSVLVRATRTHDLLFFPWQFNIGSCAQMRIEANEGGSSLPIDPAATCN
jgi:hypothetical protein